MYKRSIEQQLKESLFKKKIVILYGPRQVGKTTLVKKIYHEYDGKKIYLQADIPSVREGMSKAEPAILKTFFNDSKLIIIDEAQLIENIGVILKVYFDTYPDVQIIATGSSSFDLANKVREPLTGRAREFMLYPLSVGEIIATKGIAHYKSKEEDFFRYGMYPAIMDIGEVEIRNSLGALENNTFYKDILMLENIRKPKVLQDLIKFLAFNIGSIVTSSNISREIGTTIKTVDRYIDILEKMFVIKKLYGYSNNKSNEIKKGYKIYFVDNGLRNSVIDNFNSIENRGDVGAIFENFFITEKIKSLEYTNDYAGKYFWQGERGLEIDYLEEKDGKVTAFECKYKNRKSKGVNIFKNNYPKAEIHIVHKENYIDLLISERS